MISAFYVSNIIMHVIFMTIFLTIFFFTYGSYVERETVKNQVNFVVDDLFDSIKPFLPDESRKKIKSEVATYKENIDVSKDEIVIQHNNKIKKTAMTAVIIFLIIGTFVIYTLMKKLDMQHMSNNAFIKKLLKHNFIVIIFIALTEYIFLSVFSKNYISIDLNVLKKNVMNKLADLIAF